MGSNINMVYAIVDQKGRYCDRSSFTVKDKYMCAFSMDGMMTYPNMSVAEHNLEYVNKINSYSKFDLDFKIKSLTYKEMKAENKEMRKLHSRNVIILKRGEE